MKWTSFPDTSREMSSISIPDSPYALRRTTSTRYTRSTNFRPGSRSAAGSSKLCGVSKEEAMVDIRKIITMREMVLSELGVPASRSVVCAVGMAVILNPFAGRFVDDLRPLFEAGAKLGERLMPDLVKLLDGPAVSYGKGALVGVDGEMEHGGACVHPMLGKPMRAAIGGC